MKFSCVYFPNETEITVECSNVTEHYSNSVSNHQQQKSL